MATAAFYEYGVPQKYGWHGNSHEIFDQNNCKINRSDMLLCIMH